MFCYDVTSYYELSPQISASDSPVVQQQNELQAEAKFCRGKKRSNLMGETVFLVDVSKCLVQ